MGSSAFALIRLNISPASAGEQPPRCEGEELYFLPYLGLSVTLCILSDGVPTYFSPQNRFGNLGAITTEKVLCKYYARNAKNDDFRSIFKFLVVMLKTIVLMP